MPIGLAAEHNKHLLRSSSNNYPNVRQLCSCNKIDGNEASHNGLVISPLAMLINFPAGDAAPTLAGSRLLLESLHQEAAIYGQALGRRPVGQLLLRHPFKQFTGADITELMHVLSSGFNLNHRNQGYFEFCAEVMLSDFKADNIALLKGLGFNELMLSLSQQQLNRSGGEKLKQKWQLAQSYGFDRLSVRLAYGFIDLDLHDIRAQLDQLLELKPQRILLTDAETLNLWENCPALEQRLGQNNGAAAASQFTLIYNALRDAGYRVVGNDCFVLGRDPLATAQNQNRLRRNCMTYNAVNATDVLGLGPGSVSNIGHHFHRNHLNREDYIAAVKQGRPVHSHLQLNESGKLARVIADQLLCYHRLDIPYIDSRYNIHLGRFVEDIAWGLNQQAGTELIRIHNGLLQLNDEGVLRILYIIDKFLLELTKISGD